MPATSAELWSPDFLFQQLLMGSIDNKNSNNNLLGENQIKIFVTYGYCSGNSGFYLIAVLREKPPSCVLLSIETRFINDIVLQIGAFPTAFLQLDTPEHLEIFLKHASTLRQLHTVNFLLISSSRIIVGQYQHIKDKFPYLRLTLIDKNLAFHQDLARYIAQLESQEQSRSAHAR